MGRCCEYFAIWRLLWRFYAVCCCLFASMLLVNTCAFELALVFLALLFWLFWRLVLTIVRMGRIGWDGTEQDYD